MNQKVLWCLQDLERVLEALDALGLDIVAIHTNQAIEELRAEITARQLFDANNPASDPSSHS